MKAQPELIARTPNPDCPACQEKRRHSPEEWRQYHPLAGSSGQEKQTMGSKS